MCFEFVCAVSPVLKTSFYAALSYSDIAVSILMHIIYLNVMFCINVSYVSQSPIYFCHRLLLSQYSQCYTQYILLLSAANRVLVLLVYKCDAFLNTSIHAENKYPQVVPYIHNSVRKITS